MAGSGGSDAGAADRLRTGKRLRRDCPPACHLAVGKFGNPSALGAEDRRFKSCQLDDATRLRVAMVGVAQTVEH